MRPSEQQPITFEDHRRNLQANSDETANKMERAAPEAASYLRKLESFDFTAVSAKVAEFVDKHDINNCVAYLEKFDRAQALNVLDAAFRNEKRADKVALINDIRNAFDALAIN